MPVKLTWNIRERRNAMFAEACDMSRNSTLTLLPSPITIDIREWIMNNTGMVAVAKKLPDGRKATLYAVKKADSASPQMVKYARDNGAMILVSLSEGEVNAID